MTEARTYNKDEFEALPERERENILLGKPIMKGKGVIRRADGSIKYDNESLKGNYDEELKDGTST